MLSKQAPLKIVFFSLIGLFGFFMVHLFFLRFQTGDIYPPYSSLRSDPLGTSALFESLEHLKSVRAVRNYYPVERLKSLEDITLFFLGIPFNKRHLISKKEYERIEKLMTSGTRLVVSLRPVSLKAAAKPSKKNKDNTKKDTDKTQKEPADADAASMDFFKTIGVSVHTQKKDRDHDKPFSVQAVSPDTSVNPLSWPLGLWFEPLSEDWQTLLTAEDKPVMIEKKWGQGSIVLAADSYIFSNESLKNNTDRYLLSRLCAAKPVMMFDEFHFGIQKRLTIATLIRKYNLYGPMVIFVVFIVLIIWKRTSCLIPPGVQNEDSDLLSNSSELIKPKDNLSGLANLLTHHIAGTDLINECRSAWKAAFVKDNIASKKYANLYEKILARPSHIKRKTDPVDEYNRICRILSQEEKR